MIILDYTIFFLYNLEAYLIEYTQIKHGFLMFFMTVRV